MALRLDDIFMQVYKAIYYLRERGYDKPLTAYASEATIAALKQAARLNLSSFLHNVQDIHEIPEDMIVGIPLRASETVPDDIIRVVTEGHFVDVDVTLCRSDLLDYWKPISDEWRSRHGL